MPHLEEIFERIGRHGEMDTQIVLSTQYEGRAVAEPPAHTRSAQPSPGWSREAPAPVATDRDTTASQARPD